MSIWTDMGFDGICVDPISAKSPSAISTDLKNKRCIVIAVDAAYPAERNSRCSGIEVMLWLRLRDKFTGPVLLVGFQPAEVILKSHPEHLPMLAPGNRYEQLPISVDTKKDIEDWLAEDAGLSKENIAEKYKHFLASSFDVARHRMANIYGLKVMWDLFNVMTNDTILYPTELQTCFNDDVQCLVALAMRNRSFFDVPQWLAAQGAEFDDGCIGLESELTAIRAILTHEAPELRQLGQAKIKLFDLLSSRCNEVRKWTTGHHRIAVTQQLDVIGGACALLSAEPIQQVAPRTHARNKFAVKTDLEGRVDAIGRITRSRNRSFPRKWEELKLLVVDDHADLGWRELFQRMSCVDVVNVREVTQGSSDLKESVDRIAGAIHAKTEIAALLLDLRLLSSDDQVGMLGQVSGSMVLRAVRERRADLPVLVTTASNKLWNYQQALDIGADGYWMKEGFDNDQSDEDSLRSYWQLSDFLEGLSQPTVSVMREVAHAMRELAILGRKPWWSDGSWRDGKWRSAKVSEVLGGLSNCMHQLRVHNQGCVFRESLSDRLQEQRSLAGICTSVGVVFEFVVGSKLENGTGGVRLYESVTQQQLARAGPVAYSAIMDPRNMASHGGDQRYMVDGLVHSQTSALCAFLLSEPTDTYYRPLPVR
ncbi:MAG: hypothetical protein IPP83_13535 [Flavobacteriales bacterium]|nr:hypothetical protein [Flavobacteriales bacterium]